MKFVHVVSLLLLSLPSFAENIKVFPSSAELSADQREASFSVTNGGSVPVNVDFRVVPWAPKDYATAIDEEALLRRKAILVYPPVAQVEAGGRQVFRVILRDRSVKELALFRLQLGWRGASEPEHGASQVGLGLGYSLPLMITAPEATHRLVYQVVRLKNQLALQITNKGDRPVYIKRYKWADGSEGKLFGYVWPNHTRYYNLPNAGPPPLTVQLRTWGWSPSR